MNELFRMLASDEDGRAWSKREIITAFIAVGVLTLLTIF